MKFKNMTSGLPLVVVIIALLFLNASGCLAGGAQQSPAAVSNTNQVMSPFKGPSTAPVVITVFSDFQ